MVFVHPVLSCPCTLYCVMNPNQQCLSWKRHSKVSGADDNDEEEEDGGGGGDDDAGEW